MKLRTLSHAAAGMVFLALSCFAQITTIEGDVKGTDGKPVEKAVIKIDRLDIKGSYKTSTNKKGHYLYMGLPIGNYSITCEIDGKEVDKVASIRTRMGDPTPVNFDLAASAQNAQQRQAAMAKAAETGQLTGDMTRGMSAEQKDALEKQLKDQADKMKKNKELNDAFGSGMTAMQGKQYDVAITSFVKASELDPTQVAVWAQLGEAYVQMAGTKTGAEFDDNIQKSIGAYTKAIELKPDDPATHNNFALALAKGKKFPEMQAELKKAAELDPANGGKYYYNLGAILVNTGQNDAAADAFKKAIELTPTYADAWYQYGVTLISKASIAADGKVTPVAGTAEAFQKYLELAPTGGFADAAKEMLATLGTSVQTKFADPNAKKKTTTTKK
jgi:tetratricopeptide (TPR) repeat protein